MDSDSLGRTRLTYTQEYAGLPVFGAVLKAHFDASGKLSVVAGTLIHDIEVSAAPSRSVGEAKSAAVGFVARDGVSARSSRLLIFREGLAKGVPGDNHLAYEVEVGNGANVREFVYVDAHTGKVIDQITGTPDALDRRRRRPEFGHLLTCLLKRSSDVSRFPWRKAVNVGVEYRRNPRWNITHVRAIASDVADRPSRRRGTIGGRKVCSQAIADVSVELLLLRIGAVRPIQMPQVPQSLPPTAVGLRVDDVQDRGFPVCACAVQKKHGLESAVAQQDVPAELPQ